MEFPTGYEPKERSIPLYNRDGMHGQALIELRIPVEITTPIFKVLDHEYVPPSTADRKSEGTPSFLLATELSQVKLQASSSRQSAVFRSAVVSDCNSTLAGRIHNCLSTWILVQASLRGRDKGPPTAVLTTQACSTHESYASTAWSGRRREQVCGRSAEASC